MRNYILFGQGQYYFEIKLRCIHFSRKHCFQFTELHSKFNLYHAYIKVFNYLCSIICWGRRTNIARAFYEYICILETYTMFLAKLYPLITKGSRRLVQLHRFKVHEKYQVFILIPRHDKINANDPSVVFGLF